MTYFLPILWGLKIAREIEKPFPPEGSSYRVGDTHELSFKNQYFLKNYN